MELQFQSNEIPCLRQIKAEVQTQEQTQELRLSDGMPDIGRVLCAWGQVVTRGKEWRSDAVGLSCGVMAWVLYAPEDGSQCQCVETWLPMSLKWDIPEIEQDGYIQCRCLLHSVDARTVSSRKLMVRASVGALCRAYSPWKIPAYSPEELPQDIRLKQTEKPVCLARESGEKAYMIDEELTLPASAPAFEKLIRWSLQPEIAEQKVLGDKVIFRGSSLLHILYRTPEGTLTSWDFEIPFSQYAELEREYGHEARACVDPMVTSMELTAHEQGRLRMKVGLSGQYLIYDTQLLPSVEDAYSPQRQVTAHREVVTVPAVLELMSQRLRAEQTAAFGSSRIADTVFYPAMPHKQRKPGEISVEIPGQFQTLYYDGEGVLQAGTAHWQDSVAMGIGEEATMDILCSVGGKSQATAGEDGTAMRGEVLMETVTSSLEQWETVTALTVGEQREKDPARPSLILRKAGKEGLWEIAKGSGSTVEAIQSANGLQGEPDPDKMLLIPVL